MTVSPGLYDEERPEMWGPSGIANIFLTSGIANIFLTSGIANIYLPSCIAKN